MKFIYLLEETRNTIPNTLRYIIRAEDFYKTVINEFYSSTLTGNKVLAEYMPLKYVYKIMLLCEICLILIK